MRPPTPACADLSRWDLEDTFFYPGPYDVRHKANDATQTHWNRAKEVCERCPLLESCRVDSVGEEYGVWGGLDQLERHFIRLDRRKWLGALKGDERAAEEARVVAMVNDLRGHGVAGAARKTGYSKASIQAMVERAKGEQARKLPTPPTVAEIIKAVDLARSGATVTAIAATIGRERDTVIRILENHAPSNLGTPRWPSQPARADGWVWHHGMARSATYRGQTEDGRWVLMQFKVSGLQTQRWLPAELVHMTRGIAIDVKTYAGRDDAEHRGEAVPAAS